MLWLFSEFKSVIGLLLLFTCWVSTNCVALKVTGIGAVVNISFNETFIKWTVQVNVINVLLKERLLNVVWLQVAIQQLPLSSSDGQSIYPPAKSSSVGLICPWLMSEALYVLFQTSVFFPPLFWDMCVCQFDFQYSWPWICVHYLRLFFYLSARFVRQVCGFSFCKCLLFLCNRKTHCSGVMSMC